MSFNLFGLFKKKNKNAEDKSQQRDGVEVSKKNTPPAYLTLVREIDRMIDEKEVSFLSKQENNNMVTYTNGKRKILNINKTTEPPRTYFLFSGANHQAQELGAEGLRPVSKNEAKQKRYGPAKALYSGNDPAIIRSMLKKVN